MQAVVIPWMMSSPKHAADYDLRRTFAAYTLSVSGTIQPSDRQSDKQ